MWGKKPRSGCWLCPKQGITACRMMYFEFPQYWKQLKKLELKSGGSGFRWSERHNLDKLEIMFQDEVNIPQRTLKEFS